MYKSYDKRFPPYDPKKASPDTIASTRAAVFARIAKAAGANDKNAVPGSDSAPPQVIYPRKRSALRTAIPVLAAAAVIAAAVPLGIKLAGGRSALHGSGGISEGDSGTLPEQSGSFSADGAGASAALSENPDSAVSAPAPQDIEQPDSFKGFAAYFREMSAYLYGGTAPLAGNILDYFIPVEQTQSKEGVSITLHGVISCGNQIMWCYSCEFDDPELKRKFSPDEKLSVTTSVKLENISDYYSSGCVRVEEYDRTFVDCARLSEPYTGSELEFTFYSLELNEQILPLGGEQGDPEFPAYRNFPVFRIKNDFPVTEPLHRQASSDEVVSVDIWETCLRAELSDNAYLNTSIIKEVFLVRAEMSDGTYMCAYLYENTGKGRLFHFVAPIDPENVVSLTFMRAADSLNELFTVDLSPEP